MAKLFALATVCAALVAALGAPAHGAQALSEGCIEANKPEYDGEYSVGTIAGFDPGEVLTVTAISSVNATFHLQDLSGVTGFHASADIPGTLVYTIPTTGELLRWGIVVGTATWVVSCAGPPPPPPPPPPPLEGALADLEGMVEDNPGTPLADKAEDAATQVHEALAELEKPSPDVAAALGKLEGAAGDLEAMVTDELVTEAEGEALLEPVVAVARELASDAIADAAGGDADKLAGANSALTEGDALRDEGRYKNAVAKYKEAYAKAVDA